MPTPRIPAPPPSATAGEVSRRNLLLAGGLLVLAAVLAYHNTFAAPFIFDDNLAVLENPTIRQLWPITEVLTPPANGSGVTGRPLVNLSFALNHAVSGRDVWSYHALNLLIHAGAGLALFGLVRRTLLLPRLPERLRAASLPLGLAVAGLWLVHPLQTESVTCVVQRTESLMGLFYLLTLYGFVRGWWVGSVLACLAGMACKEVMVTAPLVVLLHDRTFVAGSFREAWRQRWRYYLGLAGTWLLLGALVWSTGGHRGGGAGFGMGATTWTYLLTQCRAIVLYLKLSVWPHPLVLDYGIGLVGSLPEVLPQALLLLALLAGALWAAVRRPGVGFPALVFFLILAPSSSVLPLVGQTIAEHRMYLSLAAVLALAVVAIHAVLGRAAWVVLGLMAIGLGVLTVDRNRDYRTDAGIWEDAVRKHPGNYRAHYNLGTALAKLPGRRPEALAQYEEAVRLQPDYPEAHFNLGNELVKEPGRQQEAIAHYEEALRLRPDYVEVHCNLATELAKIPGRLPEAIAHHEEALRLEPDFPEAHNNLANELARTPGRQAEAIAHYEAALRLKPDYAEAHNNLAAQLAAIPGRQPEAIAHYKEALRLKPGFAEAHNNLAAQLAAIPGRQAEAIAHYESALRINPDYAEAHCNLGTALMAAGGRFAEAVSHYEAAVRLAPDFVLARNNLALAYINSERLADAEIQLEAVLKLDPANAEARSRLARVRALQMRR